MIDLCRQIAKEKIVPVRAELDEKEEFPWDVLKILADAGLFGIYIPEEYGGMGVGNFDNCLVVEELSKYCIGVSVSFAASGLGGYPILLFGSHEQKTEISARYRSRQENCRLRPYRVGSRQRCRLHPHHSEA